MKRTAARVVTAAAALLMVPASGVALGPDAATAAVLTPQQIAKAQKVIGYVFSAYDLAQRVNGVPSELERATTQIITAVDAARTELLEEIDELTAAEVDACRDSALTDVENLPRMTDTQLDGFATRAVDCVNRAVNFIDTLDSPTAVDQVSFAMNTVGPLALIARARLGQTSEFLTARIRAGNLATVRRLEPVCQDWIDEENGRPLFWNVECTAFNGVRAVDQSVNGPVTDVPALARTAARHTSHELSRLLLAGGIGVTVFQKDDSRLWTFDGAGAPTPSVMAAGTRPAVATLPEGGFRKAFQAVDRTLWFEETNGHGRRVGPNHVAPGTSPSIATTSSTWTIAYNDGNMLWLADSFGRVTNTQQAMRSGSSPSITSLGGGVFMTAFVGPDNLVRLHGTHSGTRFAGNGLGAAPGTNPSLASGGPGNWSVALHGGDGRLWVVDSRAGQRRSTSVLLAGTSPSVAYLPGSGGFRVAVARSDGFLWTESPAGDAIRAGAGLNVQPGTGPSLAAVPGGWKAAFHALGGFLWTVDHTGDAVDSGLKMAPGTDPGIAGIR
jgi:hypothetical protein